MAQFRKAQITEKGLALIQKTQLYEIKLEFTSIRTGAGIYEENEGLSQLTCLKIPKQEFPISSFEAADPKTVKMSAAITNEGLQEAYYIGEIAIYAKDPDEGEIMYSLCVAYPGKADYLPAYNGKIPVNIYLDTYQAVSDSENVTISAGTGAYALARDLTALKKEVNELQERKQAVVIGMEIIIPTEGWKEDSNGMCLEIALDGVNEDMAPMVAILPGYLDIARECGMATACRAVDGGLVVWASKAPAQEIHAALTLTAPGGIPGGGSGTGTSYILPAATKARLGGVKIGENVSVEEDGTISVDHSALVDGAAAQETDVQEMLDEVFGSTETN